VSGFGAHIKSTQKKLIIQKKNIVEDYPIDEIKNLLLVGGHTLNTTAIQQLIKNGAFISFFEPDGTPVGTIRPFGNRGDDALYELQKAIPRQRYAITIVEASIKSRLSAIGQMEERLNNRLFYEGELEFLRKSQEELGYLIKLDEIRRLHRLTSDMYYEIMSRVLPPDLGFRRRTLRPHTDPVNAMLSFGYAMLYGNCCVSIIGSRMNPDIGLIHDESGSLVHDLIDPLKTQMIDRVVFSIARESLQPGDFELTSDRCMLSDPLIKKMTELFHGSLDCQKINEQVMSLSNAMRNNGEFRVLY
jgi:CRISPR-associated protein Cas1